MTEIINALATARYSAFSPWMGVPIATSLGKPKWMPGIEYVKELAPAGIFGKETSEFEFRLKYHARLDELEAQTHTALLRLSQKYPGQRLVLMCWCDITKPDGWCHRQMMAEWFAERGVILPELTRNDAPTTRTYVDAPGPGPTREVAPELFGDDFLRA